MKQYDAVLIGSFLGSELSNIRELRDKKCTKPIKERENAMRKVKSLNKILTKGEKEYYGMKYVLVEVVDGFYTGKRG